MTREQRQWIAEISTDMAAYCWSRDVDGEVKLWPLREWERQVEQRMFEKQIWRELEQCN